MATCSINTLLAENPCLSALNPQALQAIKVQMLCNLLDKLQNGGEVTCDIQTLLTQGACFYDMDPVILQVLEVQLLCDISNAV